MAVGVLFGVWSAFWPNEKPDFPTAWGVLTEGLIASSGFILCQIIYDRLPAGSFKVTRTEAGILGFFVLMGFGLQAAHRGIAYAGRVADGPRFRRAPQTTSETNVAPATYGQAIGGHCT